MTMSEAANRPPEMNLARLTEAAWPSARAGEALYALARHVGLPMASVEAVPLSASVRPEHLDGWITDAATRAALQADQAFVALDELEGLISQSAPALLRLAALDGAPFLAVVGCRGKFVRVLGPDLAIHQFRATTVSA